jgi:hypothetical protein
MKKLTALLLTFILALTVIMPVSAAERESRTCDLDVENITWQVLDQSDTEALLISKYILEYSYYDASKEYTLWEDSTLRSYLNTSFYEKFSDSQKKHILTKEYENTEIVNSNGNLEYRKNNTTSDNVSILSVEEFVKYFTIDNYGYNGLYAYSMDGICSMEDTTYSRTVTQDTVDRIPGYTSKIVGKKSDPWFLRNTSPDGTPGLVAETVWAVDASGGTHPYILDFDAGIRPVIWVDKAALTDGSFVIASSENDSETPAKGTVLTSGKNTYKVTKAGKEVAFTGTSSTAKTIKIKNSVKIGNITYKVTAVSAKALKNNTHVTSVTVGNNVKKIGSSAFYGCEKLKTIKLGTGIKSVGKNAFKGICATAKIKVPSEQLKAYKKLLKNKGQGKKTSIVGID